jgi:hypothetical protein
MAGKSSREKVFKEENDDEVPEPERVISVRF